MAAKKTKSSAIKLLLCKWTVTCSGIILLLGALPLSAQAITTEKLIRHLDQLWRGNTSRAMITMMIKTRRYQRNMHMQAWSRGKDYSLVLIQDPIKDRGIATLKVKNNIWNYLPKIGRVIKVPTSMMSGSWMGSHFTNDDLVKESTFEDDYNSSITFEGERDGHMIYELTAVPKPDAPIVWGEVVMLIDQQTLAPRCARYYDEDGILVRTIRFDQLKRVNNRVVPMRLTLQPEYKPGESTVIVYDNIAFDVPLQPAFFSLRNLKKSH